MRRAPRSSIFVAAALCLAVFTGYANLANAGGWEGSNYDGRSAGDGWRSDNWRSDSWRSGEYRPGDGRIAYGTVVAIAESERDSSSSGQVGAGAVLGGAVGAMIGRRVGSSVEAKNAGTVIGAVLGAMAGHQIERSRNKRDSINVTVRIDGGGTVTLAQDRNEDLRVGDRVQIVDSRITRTARRSPRDLEYGHS